MKDEAAWDQAGDSLGLVYYLEQMGGSDDMEEISARTHWEAGKLVPTSLICEKMICVSTRQTDGGTLNLLCLDSGERKEKQSGERHLVVTQRYVHWMQNWRLLHHK